MYYALRRLNKEVAGSVKHGGHGMPTLLWKNPPINAAHSGLVRRPPKAGGRIVMMDGD